MKNSRPHSSPDTARAQVALAGQHQRKGRLQDAIACYRRALSLKPDFFDAHLGLGTALHAAGRLAEAERALQQACRLNPRHVNSHYLLGVVLHGLGQREAALRAFGQVIRLKRDLPEAHFCVGVLLDELGQRDAAIDSFRKTIELRPNYADAHFRLGVALKAAFRVEEAIAALRESMRLRPDFPDPYIELALLLENANRLEELEPVLERGLSLVPDDPLLNLTAAMLERRKGQHAEAAKRLEHLLRTDSPRVQAALTRPEVEQLPPEQREVMERNYLKPRIHHELGLAYDKLGDPARAFKHFAESNRLKGETWSARRYDKGRYLQEIGMLQALFTPDTIASWTLVPALEEARTPVFLVGFPRSGTTLLNQILACHPQLSILEERPALAAAEGALARLPGGIPGAIGHLDENQVHAIRDAYFKAAAEAPENHPGRRLIDKLPLNLTKAGLIWRIFPNARFILALRHPCDVCLSCFMQSFQPNEAMVNFLSLEDTVALYARAMDAWLHYCGVLELEYLPVRYEDLIDNPEEETRRLADFIGVEWNEDMLRFHERVRERGIINTPSYQQVSQPLYQSARYRWRRYADWFEPFLGTLKPYLERFGYEAPASSHIER